MEKIEKIENIKQLYTQVEKKTKFIQMVADDLGKSPRTLRNHWFGAFWSIPLMYQDRIIELSQNTIKLQVS
jgi:hypothetical protein